jgi:formylglycine-generating enzyme required for sulfatase activity
LHPVEQVSWRDCELALEHAGLALPSEAQWEFGARGGTSTPWWTGPRAATIQDKDNVLDGFAWRNGGNRWGPADLELNDGYTSHARVGSFPANPFGLHEVIGNVAEWCRDGFDGAFYRLGSRIDPCASPSRSSSRVHRGGSFGYPVIQSRLSARLSDPPDKAELFIGLRPARALAR